MKLFSVRLHCVWIVWFREFPSTHPLYGYNFFLKYFHSHSPKRMRLKIKWKRVSSLFHTTMIQSNYIPQSTRILKCTHNIVQHTLRIHSILENKILDSKKSLSNLSYLEKAFYLTYSYILYIFRVVVVVNFFFQKIFIYSKLVLTIWYTWF